MNIFFFRTAVINLFLITGYFSGTLYSECFAQKQKYTTASKSAVKHYEAGTDFYNQKNDDAAKIEFIKAIKADSNFIEAHILLAGIYSEEKQTDLAIAEYKKILAINPDFFPPNYFYLAQLQLETGQYDDACSNYRKFLTYPVNNSAFINKTKRGIEICEFAVNAIKHPVPFNPVKLSDSINTQYGEYSPALTADEEMLFFTKFKPTDDSRSATEDIYFSAKKNGSWQQAMNVGSPVNTYYNEGAVSCAPDGQTLYFVSNKEGGLGKMDIYEVKKNGNRWSEPVNLGAPVNSPYSDTQPCIASDGRTLYFVSNRPGGAGNSDIWKSVKQPSGLWGNPVNLGKNINTTAHEQSPFIHPDNQTLYFISDGWTGMGKNDFFYSRMDSAGNWKTVVNMGYPINSYADERNLIVNAKGSYALMTSDFLNKARDFDIYGFELYSEARPVTVNYVKGKVYDFETKKKLDAKFELIDLETEKVIIESVSNKGTGEFLVCIPANKNYALNVSREGYLFYSENFSLKEAVNLAKDAYLMDVPLRPVKAGESVVLKNIFFETNDFSLKNESGAELKKLVSFLNFNATVKIEISGHTDNTGVAKNNQLLSEKRAKAVYDYLTGAGIAKERLSYKGYGDTRPIATNNTEKGKAQNRRTEFTVR